MDAISKLAKQGRWTVESVTDLGSMSGRCSICGSPLRYEYHVHPLDDREATRPVGSTCGPTLVQASWSEAYWTQMQADFERQLGRQMTAAEIESKKKETSKAEWKRMAKDFIARQQEEAKKTLPTMLERYVTLRPWHRFASSILAQLKQGRRLTVKQIEVATGMIAETDWDALEAEATKKAPIAERVLSKEERDMDESGPDLLNRMNALLQATGKMTAKAADMVESFAVQLGDRGSLSPKQLEIVTELEQRYLGAKPTAAVEQVAGPKEKLVALLGSGRLSVKQKDMLQEFKTQSKPLTARQVEIIEDIFKRLGLVAQAAPVKPVESKPREEAAATLSQMSEEEIPF